MSKVRRELYEFNNRMRSAWGEDPLPPPEDGFADEPPPPYADLLPVVEDWFREATGGQPHRPRQPKIPPSYEVAVIARLIFELKTEARPTHDPRRDAAIAIGHQLQRSVAETQAGLAELLHLALPGATPGDPAVGRLLDLWNAAKLAEPYIGPPHKQGPQTLVWHVMARVLAPLVTAAFVSAGLKHLSVKADGPVVRVICKALYELEGIEYEPAAVASCLRRARKKGATKN